MLTVSTHNTGDTITAAFGNNWEIQAYDAIVDGWADESSETWTYASTVSFTISGDKSTKYRKGQKIRLVQTSTKYFYNVGTSYSTATGNTTVTIAENADYSLSSTESITAPAISSIESPHEFPGWFNWTPILTGFTTGLDPTNTAYRFRITDKMVNVAVRQGADGTSNANTFTISAPIRSANVSNAIWLGWGTAVDNGAFTGTVESAQIVSNSTIFTLSKNLLSTGWTASGGKRMSFGINYEY